MTAEEHAGRQLGRLRAMVGMYHRMFFSDVRTAFILVVAFLALGRWGIAQMFLVVTFVCLWAATQAAFDASYLIMARHDARSKSFSTSAVPRVGWSGRHSRTSICFL